MSVADDLIDRARALRLEDVFGRRGMTLRKSSGQGDLFGRPRRRRRRFTPIVDLAWDGQDAPPW
jgi:hypothetical protein